MNSLVFDLTGVPAAAESFHQINGGDHLLAEQLRLQTLADEQRRLRIDYVEVAGRSADIAIIGDHQSAAGIVDGSALRRQGLGERTQIADSVFDFLKCR